MGRKVLGMIEHGPQPALTAGLRARGWPVAGVYVGGCVARGTGSSFRAIAHTHTRRGDPFAGWICIRSSRRVLTAAGEPSRLDSSRRWHK